MGTRLVGSLAVLALLAGACGDSNDAVVTAPVAISTATSTPAPFSSDETTTSESADASVAAGPTLPIPSVSNRMSCCNEANSSKSWERDVHR